MSILGALVAAWNLLVFGAHALVPFRLAADPDAAGPPREGPPARRRWALLAPALLASSIALTAVELARRPDAAAAWGLGDVPSASPLARIVGLAVAALFVTDLLVAAGWRRLEPAGWRIAGAIGVVGAAAHAFGSELLRAGWGPAPATLALLLALVALRLPLSLAAAELALGAPRRWTPLAGPALLVAALLWPAALRGALGGAWLTVAAAAILLAGARFLPGRLARAAGVAGLLLAVLLLARAAEIGRIQGAREILPEILLAP